MTQYEGEGLFSLAFRLQRTLPDDDQVPAVLRPRLLVRSVANDVAAELFVPERLVRLRTRRCRAERLLDEFSSVPRPTVVMPEASTYLDQRPTGREDDVGMSSYAPVAHAKSVSVRK